FSAGLTAVVGTAAFALMTAQPISAQSQTTPPPDPQTPRSSSPSPQTSAPNTQTPRASGDQVTVSGCIQREADYRRSAGARRGRVLRHQEQQALQVRAAPWPTNSPARTKAGRRRTSVNGSRLAVY